MAIQNFDTYFARAVQRYLGQTVINTFWYVLGSGNGGQVAASLIQSMRTFFWEPLAQVMSEEWALDSLEVMNWRVPDEDFAVNQADIVGIDQDSMIPSFVAVAMRSPKGAPGQRYSYSRLTGFGESKIDGNLVVPDTNMASALAFRGTIQQETNGDLYPVQVSSENMPKLGAGNPSTNRNLDGIWTYQIGTQNSRKPGVGA